MHNHLLVLEIPKRWYLLGDAPFAAVGQAYRTRRSRKESIWGGDRMTRKIGSGGVECKGSGPSAMLLANERRLIR